MKEALELISRVLPERMIWLLPGVDDPDLTVYSQDAIANVRVDDQLPVFVVTSREDGRLVEWGEGVDVLDATRKALNVLKGGAEHQEHERQEPLRKAA